MIKEALLWESRGDNRVACSLCAHRCVISDGNFGTCGMRQNKGGVLYTHAYGNVVASHPDSVEKKPFYHFHPGTYAYSVATNGCNFRCSFCQNWRISQLSARDSMPEGYELKPEEIVREARRLGCAGIAYTYTEPTIFLEYARETAILARDEGLYNCFVSNGYMTPEAVEEMGGVLDAVNIDLKFFSEASYQRLCGGSLAPVLESIRRFRDAGLWMEITTLLVPGENDSDKEIGSIASFIFETGKDIPWHISRYHPDYKHTAPDLTPLRSMRKAKEIGERAGLSYVYPGNVADPSRTCCPACGTCLIERDPFAVRVNENSFKDGRCISCGTVVAGVW